MAARARAVEPPSAIPTTASMIRELPIYHDSFQALRPDMLALLLGSVSNQARRLPVPRCNGYGLPALRG
jgi:hypothetical protein